ncbi:hypothetical protein NHQ30_008546 [Ciborinia camelliae]|nr:hypothetical protein NHQ30_008546 [Ciborinia camelliae]
MAILNSQSTTTSTLMGLPAELDLNIWELLKSDLSNKFPPRLLEIHMCYISWAYEVAATSKARRDGYDRPKSLGFQVKSIRESQNIPSPPKLSSRAFYLSTSRFKLDHKIKNPVFFRPGCDALFFRTFDTLQDYAEATKGTITAITESGLAVNEAPPKIERLVVQIELRTLQYGNYSFPLLGIDSRLKILTIYDLLSKLLPSIREMNTLKGIILLVQRQSLGWDVDKILCIDDDLSKVMEESPDDFALPSGVKMPRVTVMTIEKFESIFGWEGLGQTEEEIKEAAGNPRYSVESDI